mgnify:CR=1 FL=1
MPSRISRASPRPSQAGWRPRSYHPFSGGFDVKYYDFATPLAGSIDVHWQVRHRLEKTDPSAAVREREAKVVLIVPARYPETWRLGQTSQVEVVYDSSDQDTRAPVARLNGLLQAYGRQQAALERDAQRRGERHQVGRVDAQHPCVAMLYLRIK